MTDPCPCDTTPAARPVTRVKGKTWRFVFTIRSIVVTVNPDGSKSYAPGDVIDLTGNTYLATIYFPFAQPPIQLSPDLDATDLLHGIVAFKVAPSMTMGVTIEDPNLPPQTRIEVDETSASDIDPVAILAIRVVDPANAVSAASFSQALPTT